MKSLRTLGIAALTGLVGLAAVPGPAMADAIADFYKGKRLVLIIATDPGGGYDTYARLVSRNMGRHIPGNPKFIVKNMPGASGIRALNWLYNVAAQDGTIVQATLRGVPFVQVLGQKGPRFIANKLNWLGSLNNEAGILKVWTATTPAKTLKEAMKKVVLLGGSGPGSDSEIYPSLLNNTIGTKFRIITGYPASTSIDLATERNEVHGQSRSYSSMVARYPNWRNKFTLLVQLSLKKHPAIPEVPLIFEFLKTEEHRTLWRLTLTQKVMGRPYVLGPKVPKARVKAMRAAFMSMVKDPKFLAEAKKQGREIVPVSGQEIQRMINTVASAPKEIIAKLNDYTRYKGKRQVVKIKMAKHTGKVTATKKGGRRIFIMYKGKEVKAKVSGSRTKVTLDGKKVKRKAIKVGMTCTFTYPGAGMEAKKIDCKS